MLMRSFLIRLTSVDRGQSLKSARLPDERKDNERQEATANDHSGDHCPVSSNGQIPSLLFSESRNKPFRSRTGVQYVSGVVALGIVSSAGRRLSMTVLGRTTWPQSVSTI
jgi:hypothetical protein